MAGDWIAMRTDLAEDPAVIQIAAVLGMDEFGVIGRLHKVWCWADSQTTNGNAHVTVRALPKGALCNGASVMLAFLNRYVGAEGFAEAMLSVGWLAQNANGVSFPNFDRWNLQTGKERILTSRRVARHRAENVKRKCNGASVTKTLPQDSTEQKRREEETPTPLQGCPHRKPRKVTAPKETAEGVPIPPGLDTPEFLTAWSEWIADRAERRKPLTARAAREQLRLLEPLGPANAIRCIRDSIAHQWQGLFPDKYAGKPGTAQQSKANSDERVMQQIMEGLQHP